MSSQLSMFQRGSTAAITQPVDPDAPRAIGNGMIRVTKAHVVALPTRDWETIRAAVRAWDSRAGLYWAEDTPAVRRALGMEER